MTPILLGRWQSRIVLMGLVGSLVTALFGWAIGDITTPFFILGYVLILGLFFDIIYDMIQKSRWDRDWPPVLHFTSGVVEGTVMWILIQIAPLPGIPDRMAFGAFLVHYILVWVAVFAILWGPMKVFFPSWRFNGGLALSAAYSTRGPISRSSGVKRPVMTRKTIYAAAVAAIGGLYLLINGILFVGVSSGAELAGKSIELWIDNPADGGRVPMGEPVAIRWRAFQPVSVISFDVIVNGETIGDVPNTSFNKPFAKDEFIWHPPDATSYQIEVIARDARLKPIRTATAQVTAHTSQPLFAGVDVDHTLKNPMYVQVFPAFPVQSQEVCRNVTLHWTKDWRGDDYSMRIWSIDKPGVGFSIYNIADPFFSAVLEPDSTYQWTVWSKVPVPVSEESRIIETFRTNDDVFCPSWKNDRLRAKNRPQEPIGQSELQKERYALLREDATSKSLPRSGQVKALLKHPMVRQSFNVAFPTDLTIGLGIVIITGGIAAYPLSRRLKSRADTAATADQVQVAKSPTEKPKEVVPIPPVSTSTAADLNIRKITSIEQLERLNKRLDLASVIFLFWAIFWVLNGGDKFFNGSNILNTDGPSRTDIITTDSSEFQDFRNPVETQSDFGVATNYSSQLSPRGSSASVFLYGMATLELLFGATFAVLFVRKFLIMEDQKGTLFGSGVLPHLTFKGSALGLTIFIAGDILFGDQTGLWQHGTYFAVVLVSYFFYVQHQRQRTGPRPIVDN